MKRVVSEIANTDWMHRPQDRRLFVTVSSFGLLSLILGGCTKTVLNTSAISSSSAASNTSSEASVEASSSSEPSAEASSSSSEPATSKNADPSLGTFIEGEEEYRGFIVDDVLEHPVWGDIHFSMHIPEDYDGSEPYALYVHCPGVEGFYSEGAGAHLVEDFVFVANDYVEDMIVITPQFDDWREVSAFMASALVDWALATFNIDESRLFLSGYSYGGETISYVMGLRPDLFKRVLQVSSQWDSDINALVETLPAIRISLGDNDEFYTVENAEETFNQIRELYEAAGISGDELDDLVKLDVFPEDDFEDPENQHDETPSLVIFDSDIMAWLFNVG